MLNNLNAIKKTSCDIGKSLKCKPTPKLLTQYVLAHLSRRLIGELIVYPCSGVRPSVRRPFVRRPSSSTISKIFFSETAGPIVLILHIHHLQVGGKNNCVFFCFDRIRTLVAMATYASHRLIMEKSENCQFLLSCWRYLNFVFAEMFIEYSSTFHVTFVLILHFDWLQGPHIGQNFEKH